MQLAQSYRKGKNIVSSPKRTYVLFTRHNGGNERPEVRAGENAVKVVGNEGEEQRLYGRWQTDPIIVPLAKDGIVPKTGRGHVELWTMDLLPGGCVYLEQPRLGATAKRLGIDFAPAMVGFERRNRRTVPAFRGVVVCKEFSESLLLAHTQLERERELKLERKRSAVLYRHWREMVRGLVMRHQAKLQM